MKYEIYTDITFDADYSVFDFISSGKNGAIKKLVAFTPTDMKDVYNLAFGDLDEHDIINDYSISNNGDRNKILATIVVIIKAYTDRYPDRWILFRGSSEERTRLYRMAISLNLEDLSVTFRIYGIVQGGDIIEFKKNMAIPVFLIKRKKA